MFGTSTLAQAQALPLTERVARSLDLAFAHPLGRMVQVVLFLLAIAAVIHGAWQAWTSAIRGRSGGTFRPLLAGLIAATLMLNITIGGRVLSSIARLVGVLFRWIDVIIPWN